MKAEVGYDERYPVYYLDKEFLSDYSKDFHIEISEEDWQKYIDAEAAYEKSQRWLESLHNQRKKENDLRRIEELKKSSEYLFDLKQPF